MPSRSKRRHPLPLVFVVGLAVLAGSIVMSISGDRATAASGIVSGRMFLDGGADGEFNGSDVGVGGQEIRAYDSTGALVGSATTRTSSGSTGGTYQLDVTGAATSRIRIEFPTPIGYQSTLVSGVTGGARSSIQFVALGATNVNYGIFVPADYCQLTASMASVCINQGSRDVRTDERVVGLTSFEPATNPSRTPPVALDQSSSAVTTISTKGGANGVGATWGLGWQKTTRLLWNSAVIRRHAALGPKGLGGVYVHDLSGQQVASFDLVAEKNLVLEDPADAGSDSVADYSDAARDIVSAAGSGRLYDFLSRDKAGFEGVGMVGLGDLDISQDSQFLWVTNLYERKIHRIALAGTNSAPTLGTVTTWTVANGFSCGTKGPLRPWGIDTNSDGNLVVAAVCANEGADPNNKELPGAGVILKLNPSQSDTAGAWTKLTEVDFSYDHRYEDGNPAKCATAPLTCKWKAWSNDWSKLKVVSKFGTSAQYWWTQPMIVDIEQLADGSFALGISDRLSYQLGSANYEPVDNGVSSSFVTGWTAGDTLLLCKTATGWQQESAGRCDGVNTYQNNRGSTLEFFYDEKGHSETTIGGLALGRGQLAVTAMDPADYFLSGVRWVSVYNGYQTNALNMNEVSTVSSAPGFGKSAGMGDVEALCDAAPLQIGNRVWYDDDRDGIQDPEEGPVVGVTVRLYDGSTLVGTAVTNVNGEYYFTSTNTEAANGGVSPDEFGGGLQTGKPYTVVLDDPDDCLPGAPLDGFILTYEDKNTAAGPPDRDNLIDSDAVSSGASWCGAQAATVTVLSLSVGDVNHSYDIGFWKDGHVTVWPEPGPDPEPQPEPQPESQPEASVPSVTEPTVAKSEATTSPMLKVSVGDYVWWDLDRDGIQDASDIPIPGVVLSIKNVDGSAVTDVNGKPVTTTVTDANGKYSFDNLPPGQYVVTVTPPEGGIATKAGAGKNRAKDSSTGSATSVLLTTDGQRDPTLDFGFYRPSVSVGNLVWRDAKGDGLQNVSDKGLAGFTLTLRKFTGGTVTDVYGRVVRPVRSKSDGKYLFTDLPEGRYIVKITYPRGYVPTTPDRPVQAFNSSTAMALSRALKAGQSDLTLDFGVVSRPGERYKALPSTF